jgi:phenylacetate-CoA ligase
VPSPPASSPDQAPTRRFWNPKIQTLPRAELEALQLKRLQEATGIAYDRGPFFSWRFDAAGFKR